MTKTAKQYVTVRLVVAANAKLVSNLTSALSKVTPLGKPLPPRPSRESVAEAGSRALKSMKAAR